MSKEPRPFCLFKGESLEIFLTEREKATPFIITFIHHSRLHFKNKVIHRETMIFPVVVNPCQNSILSNAHIFLNEATISSGVVKIETNLHGQLLREIHDRNVNYCPPSPYHPTLNPLSRGPILRWVSLLCGFLFRKLCRFRNVDFHRL